MNKTPLQLYSTHCHKLAEWSGLRPKRRAEINTVDKVIAHTNFGLEGDRYAGCSGKRQVTLIQLEHLPAIGSMLGIVECAPELLRRDIAVSGINLLSLEGKQFEIGDAVLEYTGPRHPCSLMETIFGPGGYNAVRGHRGITARVLKSGTIALTNKVLALAQRQYSYRLKLPLPFNVTNPVGFGTDCAKQLNNFSTSRMFVGDNIGD